MFNVSFIIAFSQGLLSFLSPCVLPLVPAYLGYLAGSSFDKLSEKRWLLLRNALFYSLGFTIVFVTMGATATALGSFIRDHADTIRIISGILVILFGIFILDIIPLTFLQKEKRSFRAPKNTSIFSAILMGMAFAFGWTPCIGPTLASVLMLAANQSAMWRGILLLFAYSAGMALPFLLIALFLNSLRRPLAALKKHMLLIRRISGILLIAMGILMLTGTFTLLAQL